MQISSPKTARNLKRGRGVTAEIMTITPPLAAKWLQANDQNRRISPRQVSFLAHVLKAGDWKLNGETIVIASNKKIANGQHRLSACVETGIPFDSVVVHGILFEDSFPTSDQSKVRTIADVAYIEHRDVPVFVSQTAAYTARWIHRLRSGITSAEADRKQSNQEIKEKLDDDPRLWRCAETAVGYPKEQKVLPDSLTAALLYLCGEQDPELASQFIEQVSTGTGMTGADPAYHLRSLLLADMKGLTRMRDRQKAWCCVKAWNALRAGRKVGRSSALRPRPNENYPGIK